MPFATAIAASARATGTRAATNAPKARIRMRTVTGKFRNKAPPKSWFTTLVVCLLIEAVPPTTIVNPSDVAFASVTVSTTEPTFSCAWFRSPTRSTRAKVTSPPVLFCATKGEAPRGTPRS